MTKKHLKEVFKVKHTTEQIPDELNLIVDLGGVIDDVFVSSQSIRSHKSWCEYKGHAVMIKKDIEGIESGSALHRLCK